MGAMSYKSIMPVSKSVCFEIGSYVIDFLPPPPGTTHRIVPGTCPVRITTPHIGLASWFWSQIFYAHRPALSLNVTRTSFQQNYIPILFFKDHLRSSMSQSTAYCESSQLTSSYKFGRYQLVLSNFIKLWDNPTIKLYTW